MTPVLLYITAANREEAISLSRELLAAKLIACTNIIENVTAMYRWQGEIEHEHECVVIAKSFTSHEGAITKRVKELHSYECPCIISVPITGGSEEYFAWMRQQVAEIPA